MNQVPIINVTVNMPLAKETPEEKEVREKAEARKRYLDSLVDR
jgi:ribosomal protein S21